MPSASAFRCTIARARGASPRSAQTEAALGPCSAASPRIRSRAWAFGTLANPTRALRRSSSRWRLVAGNRSLAASNRSFGWARSRALRTPGKARGAWHQRCQTWSQTPPPATRRSTAVMTPSLSGSSLKVDFARAENAFQRGRRRPSGGRRPSTPAATPPGRPPPGRESPKPPAAAPPGPPASPAAPGRADRRPPPASPGPGPGPDPAPPRPRPERPPGSSPCRSTGSRTGPGTEGRTGAALPPEIRPPRERLDGPPLAGRAPGVSAQGAARRSSW